MAVARVAIGMVLGLAILGGLAISQGALHRSSPPTLAAGTWTAQSVTRSVLASDDDDWVGRRLERSWVVYRPCQDGSCGLRLARQAALWTEDAPLVRHGDNEYVATFTSVTDGCRTPRKGLRTKRFILVIEDGGHRVEATERWEGLFPGCGRIPGRDGVNGGVTTWTAVSASPSCPAPAGDCQYGDSRPVFPLPRPEQSSPRPELTGARAA